MTKQATTNDLWAGTDDSLMLFAEAQAKVEARMGLGGDVPAGHSLLHVQDGIGVVSVRGLISNVDSPYNTMFGLTSYPAISEALIQAASNPDIKSIVLDVDTPGGAVAGVVDASELISTINKQVKPVDAYVSNSALSAGYWLASAARKIYASKTASVGSIGVIMTHVERSAQLKEDGINVTVLRAGKYKALASGVEPLTSEARAQIQETLDAAYAVFAQHVVKARGMTMPVFEATAGQGRVFLGAKGLDVGLVDGVKSFTEVFNDAVKTKTSNGSYRAESTQNLEGEDPMPKILTDQDIAALASGAAVTPPAAVVTPAVTEPAAAAEGAVDGEGPGGAAPAAAAAVVAIEGASVAAFSASAVDVLQAQVTAKDALLLTAHVQVNALQAQVAQLQEAQGPLMAIVGKSLSNMQVALGGTPTSIEGRSATDVLAEHGRLSETFSTKFKAGGVSATSAVEALTQGPKAPDSLHKARIAATQPQR